MRTAYFDRFEINMTLNQALYGLQQGKCDSYVADLLQEPDIIAQLDAVPAADLAAELYEYGAWNDDELYDNQDNRARIVWIACGNIREDEATSEK